MAYGPTMRSQPSELTKPRPVLKWNGMEWNGMEWNGMEWNGRGNMLLLTINHYRYIIG